MVGKYFLSVQNKDVALDYQAYITSKESWSKIGVISFNLPLLAGFSIGENIMLPLMYSENIKRKFAEPLVYEILKRLNLHNTINFREKKLSDYEIVIVKYLRAIIRRPEGIVFVMPSLMIHSEDYDKFLIFVSSLVDFNITIIEAERYLNDYLEVNFTGVNYQEWQTHVLNLLK